MLPAFLLYLVVQEGWCAGSAGASIAVSAHGPAGRAASSCGVQVCRWPHANAGS